MFPSAEIEPARLREIVAVNRLIGRDRERVGEAFSWRGFSVQVFPAFHSAERRAASLAKGRCVVCHQRPVVEGLKRCQHCRDGYRPARQPCARCGGATGFKKHYCDPCRPLADLERRRERAAARAQPCQP